MSMTYTASSKRYSYKNFKRCWNSGLDFDGTDDYVEVDYASGFNFSDKF